MTRRASVITWICSPTAPARKVNPSMISASNRTSPRMFGSPPKPTLWSAELRSTSRVPASTASTAVSPCLRTVIARGMPIFPLMLLTIIKMDPSEALNIRVQRMPSTPNTTLNCLILAALKGGNRQIYVSRRNAGGDRTALEDVFLQFPGLQDGNHPAMATDYTLAGILLQAFVDGLPCSAHHLCQFLLSQLRDTESAVRTLALCFAELQQHLGQSGRDVQKERIMDLIGRSPQAASQNREQARGRARMRGEK